MLEKSLQENLNCVKLHINNQLQEQSWNKLFHEIIKICDIEEQYP